MILNLYLYQISLLHLKYLGPLGALVPLNLIGEKFYCSQTLGPVRLRSVFKSKSKPKPRPEANINLTQNLNLNLNFL